MKMSKLIDPRLKPTLEKMMKQPLPIKVAYRLRGSVKKVDEELVHYFSLHKALISKFAVKDESGAVIENEGMVTVPQDLIPEFQKELNDLHEIDVDFPGATIDELGSDIQLTIEDMLVLDGFIV